MALAAMAGTAVWMQAAPTRPGTLSPQAHTVFAAVAKAVLDGSLPESGAQRQAALHALGERIEILVAHLPPHAQDELSQLMAILGTTPGRRWLADVSSDWTDAPVREVQAGLQAMRVSRLALRRQAYQALHDIVGGAYFSEPSTWAMLGYPGPAVQFS